MWKALVAFFSLLAATAFPLHARDGDQLFFQHPPGTRVYTIWDSTQLVTTGKDTSELVYIGGCDLLGYHVWYHSLNDDMNVKLYFDLSSNGKRWISWRPGAFDSVAMVSATTDIDTIGQITNPPNYAPLLRVRAIGSMTAGDTVRVNLELFPQWLPQAINP